MTRQPGAAALLFSRIESLTAATLALRAQGGCAGGLSLRQLLQLPQSTAPFSTVSARTSRAPRLLATHLRRGHDEGCRALGVPLPALDAAITRWDSSGAAPLAREALAHAVADILSHDAVVGTDYALRSLSHALRARVTFARLVT